MAVEQLRLRQIRTYSQEPVADAVVAELLTNRRLTIATAESCSGGLLASRLTDTPGSSAYMQQGVVCYTNESKTQWLGIPPALIEEYGAVSEPVAKAMAAGIRAKAAADVGVGVTGIAGPGGGTAEKPVGTVVSIMIHTCGCAEALPASAQFNPAARAAA